jgi:hypothetical protein
VPKCPEIRRTKIFVLMKTFESTTKRSAASDIKWTPDARQQKQPTQLSISEHANDPHWALVQRIVASQSLRRSTLLANFLLFVCDRHLSGRTSEINEKQIGFHVFNRMEGYNASDDNIVRNYARTLRKRLEDYFATEGRHEEFILSIPRGGYVPVFAVKDAEADSEELLAGGGASADPGAGPGTPEGSLLTIPIEDQRTTDFQGSSDVGFSEAEKLEEDAAKEDDLSEHAIIPEEDERPKQTPRWGLKRLYVLATICSIALSALAGYIGAHGLPRGWLHREPPGTSISRVFWNRIFEEDRNTYIVPTDGGLVMLQSFIREHVSLEDYASGSYRTDSAIQHGIVGLAGNLTEDDMQRLTRKVGALGNRRYTSIADLELTTRLARLPEVVPERLLIRYARDLRIDDLRTDNVILIGSIEGNPWVDLFQRQLNFRFLHGAEFGGSGIIENRHPLPEERPTYASEPNDPLLRTYGLIAYVPNLDGTGHVLLIEGVNMAGTQAAGEFLLNPAQMQAALERAKGPNGVIRPFEILIATDNIAANASQPHVLSERVG